MISPWNEWKRGRDTMGEPSLEIGVPPLWAVEECKDVGQLLNWHRYCVGPKTVDEMKALDLIYRKLFLLHRGLK